MIKDICKDIIFLGQKSAAATAEDLSVGQDLMDTLAAHSHECVGMAANMIGIAKRVIVFDDGGKPALMYNPEIVRKARPFETEEGCLSLTGRRKTTRYETIKVSYQNEKMQTRLKTYSGWTAQIIQHEIDHLNGIII